MIEVAMVLALAMQDATTRCREFGGVTTCNTTQNTTAFDAFNRAREASQNSPPSAPRDISACAGGDWLLAGCTWGQHSEAKRQRDASALAGRVRAETMTMLRAGDCQGAVNKALETGDLGFATEVRQFCAVTPPAANSTRPGQ